MLPLIILTLVQARTLVLESLRIFADFRYHIAAMPTVELEYGKQPNGGLNIYKAALLSLLLLVELIISNFTSAIPIVFHMLSIK